MSIDQFLQDLRLPAIPHCLFVVGRIHVVLYVHSPRIPGRTHAFGAGRRKDVYACVAVAIWSEKHRNSGRRLAHARRPYTRPGSLAWRIRSRRLWKFKRHFFLTLKHFYLSGKWIFGDARAGFLLIVIPNVGTFKRKTTVGTDDPK